MVDKRTKIPILMYHEVSERSGMKDLSYPMTPSYYLLPDAFDGQMRILFERGYRTILFDEAARVDTEDNYAVLTFDDGWIGNYEVALPILKKYGFKATCFVAVGLIGSLGFMNWENLKELVRYGVSIQSHGVSHKPLQVLNRDQIYRELRESKDRIEETLGNGVYAISFPHGSYDQRIIKTAEKVGYSVMCTSNILCTYGSSFRTQPAILGRIPIANNIDQRRFVRLLEFDGKEIMKEKVLKGLKKAVKGIIGIENYRKLYRKHFNIVSPEDSGEKKGS